MANPNPSPETRFKPGQSGNPGGKTAEQLRIDREAAAMAAELRHKILSSLTGKVGEGVDPLEFIDANVLRLFKDSEDRAHGTPQASTVLKGDENNPLRTVTKLEREIVRPSD